MPPVSLISNYSKMKELNKQEDYWKLRLQMTRHLMYDAMKKMAANSGCQILKEIAARVWMSGLNPFLDRMLPDGSVVKGAPMLTDIAMRDEIVSEIYDGLKQRIRDGHTEPRSLFLLNLYEYDILLALTQLYQESLKTELAPVMDVYKCSSLETTVWTLLHVAKADDSEEMVCITKPLSDEDFEACLI